jgi:hypothetical protein
MRSAVFLLDGHEVQAELPGPKGAGQPGGPGADDQQIDRAVGVRLSAEAGCVASRAPPRHGIGGGGALGHGRAHERKPAELPGQKEAGYADGLQVLVERGEVAPIAQIAQGQSDGAGGAGRGTESVTHAAGAVDDRRLAVKQ